MDPVTPPATAHWWRRRWPTASTSSPRGYGHIVSPNVCGPRLVASFVDEAGFGKLSDSCIAYFEQSRPPPLWPDRLEPKP